MERCMSDRSFYKKFFSIYIALVLQNVVTLSVNLADNMMLGAYSETALAGVAVVKGTDGPSEEDRGVGDACGADDRGESVHFSQCVSGQSGGSIHHRPAHHRRRGEVS